MPVTATILDAPRTTDIATSRLKPNRLSLSVYGDPAAEIEDLVSSIRDHGVLVALWSRLELHREPGRLFRDIGGWRAADPSV